jgi:hypothetical protein
MLKCCLPTGAIDRESVESFKRRTAAKLAGVRCPRHRQAPRLRFEGSDLKDIKVSLSGCCPKLMELANQAIASCDK